MAIAILLSASADRHIGQKPVQINVAAHLLTTDNLGNVYAVTGNTIRMYNQTGKITAEFTMRQYDQFDDLDAADPFKILAFNRNTGEIIRLDNKLVPQGQPNSLFNSGISDPTLVGNSWDGGIWVYDKRRHEVIRINQHGNIDVQSGNLAAILPEDASITMIREHGFMLYMSSPSHGILIFDRFANLIRNIPEKDIVSFQVIAEKLLYLKNNKLQILDTKTRTSVSHQLPGKAEPMSARVEGNKIIIRYPQNISIYPLNITI